MQLKTLNKILGITLAVALNTPAQAAPNADGEEIPNGEAQAIKSVVDIIHQQVESEALKNGHAFRDAHRKHHGCVNAKFDVLPNLPAQVAKGLFAKEASYNAWVRYSNGSGEAKSDREGDGRGMAVKVLGVSGPRNLGEFDDEPTSQDFLMINHPQFFVRNAIDYVSFQEHASSGRLLWWLLNPAHIFHETVIAKAIQGKIMVNPLDSTYWSMVPSRLGTQQMKFSATPCAGGKFTNSSDSDNRLGENLTATLAKNEACFIFRVQLRTNPKAMPIEDATIEWSEEESKPIPVAKITIAQQKPEQGEFCEALSFNPWNGLADHRPLGGISRARKEVYQEISRLRHGFNKQKRAEPRAQAD
jgi:hypothetical protein